MTEKYNVVFEGQIMNGANVDAVKKNLAAIFKTDISRIEALFSGEPRVIKAKVDQATAMKYRATLRKAGAICSMVPVGEPVASVSPAASAVSSGASQASVDSPDPPAATSAQGASASLDATPESMTLAPVGSDLGEIPRPAAGEVKVPDLEVAEPGASMLEDQYQSVLPDTAPDISHLSVSEGDFDLREGQPPKPEAIAPDVSSISVAEPGADLEQLPDERPPVKVDTDHLSLD